jgi:hypothetical protein
MDRAVLTAFAIAALFAAMAPTSRSVAMTPATPYEHATATEQHTGRARIVDFICDWKCARRWPPRQYWQWDQRPIWDDPWTVLGPNFWGSPEPDLVPADRWAHEWHPPWIRYRHAHHPH